MQRFRGNLTMLSGRGDESGGGFSGPQGDDDYGAGPAGGESYGGDASSGSGGGGQQRRQGGGAPAADPMDLDDDIPF